MQDPVFASPANCPKQATENFFLMANNPFSHGANLPISVLRNVQNPAAPGDLLLRRSDSRLVGEPLRQVVGLLSGSSHLGLESMFHRLYNPEHAKEKSMFNKALYRTLVHDESGQNLIEYALVAGLIGLAAVVAMTGLGTSIKTAFNSVASQLTSAV